MNDRDALVGHGVLCFSIAAAMAAGIVLNFLLGFILVFILMTTRGIDTAGTGMLLWTVLAMKSGAVLGAVVGCWALHRLYWRCDDDTYRRRCGRVGLVILLEITTAALLLLGIALLQPMMAMFRTPLVLPLFCLAWLFPAMFLGHVIRVRLTAKLLSAPIGQLENTGLDTPKESARHMIAGLTRLALSPVVVVKAMFQGFIGLFDGCMDVDLGNRDSGQRKKPQNPS